MSSVAKFGLGYSDWTNGILKLGISTSNRALRSEVQLVEHSQNSGLHHFEVGKLAKTMANSGRLMS